MGRNKSSDKVDADSGIIFCRRQGDFVKKGEKLLEVYGKSLDALESGKQQLEAALDFCEEKPEEKKLVLKEIK